MITLTTLIARGRNGGFGTYLSGAFDDDALPEEWEVPADSSKPEETGELKQSCGGNWRTSDPLAAIHG